MKIKLDIADDESAERLLAAAKHGVRFGDRKVFLGSIANLKDPTTRRVIAALYRDGLIQLARADLVAAMDPKLVSSSELTTDGATFHFLVTEPTASNWRALGGVASVAILGIGGAVVLSSSRRGRS